MIYDIKNPSDAYTMKCDDFRIAAFSVMLLGQGQYGIEGSPVMFGWPEFLKEHDMDDTDKFIKDNKSAIADCLNSVIIGSVNDREELEKALVLIPVEEHEKFLSERNERLRSSMNNIGSRAKKLAIVLME